MIESDRMVFAQMIGGVYAFYRQTATDFAIGVWWRAMQPYDLKAVEDAVGRHCVNPDAGQYLPKPADVVRMLQGGTQDSAMVAWAKVDRAVRHVGTYQSVVFDDALIHRVLHDMGGWVLLGNKDEKDWPFVAKEFENRYRGYRMRSETPEYASVMIGIAEAQNSEQGRQSQPPVLVGDAALAKTVMSGGVKTPLLGFRQATPSEMLALAAPDREAA